MASHHEWCPAGIARCPCPGASLKYPMTSWKSAAEPGFRNVSMFGGKYWAAEYPSSESHSSAQCELASFTQPRNACLPHASVEWEPNRWAYRARGFRPTLPADVDLTDLKRACDGIRVFVARTEWVAPMRTIFKKYGPPSWTSSRDVPNASMVAARKARKARCVEQLRSFNPQVCSLPNVLVWGHGRRLIDANASTYYMPPTAAAVQQAHDVACPENCRARSANVVACGGHALVGRNLMGVAYYHTLYEALGSVAFALELMQDGAPRAASHRGRGRPAVRLLENMCIPADGPQAHINMRSRTCVGGFFGKGPNAFFKNMLELIGIGTVQMQHYPYVRQIDGPAIHLDRATFDCSPAVYRHFWHALKLRAVFQLRLAQMLPLEMRQAKWGAASSRLILLVDRNQCSRPNITLSNGSVARPMQRCHAGRAVKHQVGIRETLEAHIKGNHDGWYELADFTGNEPYREQALAFYRAAVVAGPHGAAMANMIFCQKNTAIVEYVFMSALYAGYASVFGLDYWSVLAPRTSFGTNSGSYDEITPDMVLDVVKLAVRHLERGRSVAAPNGPKQSAELSNVEILYGDEESPLLGGYGTYHTYHAPTGW